MFLAPIQPPTALIVMPPGAAREEARAALRSAQFEVDGAGEPYEGTARFVERPTDLVLLSLEQFRDRDVAFIETVRRRAPHTRILLLVPEGARQEAVRALEAGADAYVLLPFYRSELAAVAARLVVGNGGPAAADATVTPDRSALKSLATEVAHAVGNPLQVISLITEDTLSAERRREVADELARIHAALEIVSRYGDLAPPQRKRGLIGPVLTAQLDALGSTEVLSVTGAPPADGPAFAFDTDQIGRAFQDMARVLAAMTPSPPARVEARLNASRNGVGRLEVWIRAPGLTPDPTTLARLRSTVIWTHGETRSPLPGLALAESVAVRHGGRLVVDLASDGASIGLDLPLEGA